MNKIPKNRDRFKSLTQNYEQYIMEIPIIDIISIEKSVMLHKSHKISKAYTPVEHMNSK